MKRFMILVGLMAAVTTVTMAQIIVKFHLPNDSVLKLSMTEVDSITFESKEHAYVDLGLESGTLWATENIGATEEAAPGDYFAWAETEPKNLFLGNWSNYKFYNSTDMITKYCFDAASGKVDQIGEVEAIDDAASRQWGAEWCYPTFEQFKELSNAATWLWEERTLADGTKISGAKVIGPNGNSIFLPATGFKADDKTYDLSVHSYYWCADVSRDLAAFACYWGFQLSPGTQNTVKHDWGYTSRAMGQTIRPVRVEKATF